MENSQNKWFDLLFANDVIVKQSIRTGKLSHNEKITHNGKLVAELNIIGDTTSYSFY